MAATPNFSPNKLLRTLSNADFALLQPHLERVTLDVRQVLEAPNKPIKHNEKKEEEGYSPIGKKTRLA
jgi:hypothetical protein